MKKLLASLLVIILSLSITARAQTTMILSSVPDGKLTLEVLQEIVSWEELFNTVHPVSDATLDTITNKEDYYCVLLIERINQKQVISCCNMEYVSISLNDIKLKDIDLPRFLKKIEIIVEIYNASSDLRLTWEHWPLNKDYMKIRIESVNTLILPATQVGQRVFLKECATLWESAQYDGSGKHSEVMGNLSIPEDCIVTVNGYAYFDDATRLSIKESYYIPFKVINDEESPEISHKRPRMYHVCTEDTDLGWVHTEDIVCVSY